MGEALAAQLVISLVRSLLLNQFILESDSVVVIQALNHSNSNFNWRISPIILESLDTIPSASSCKARKINRSANFCVTQWHIGPQPDLILAAFSFPPPLSFLPL
jgi:hypothetical protein